MKASAGAAYHVSIAKVTNLRRAISQLKEHDYWVVGLDSGSPDSIYEKSYPPRLAIVVGSEGKGVRSLNLARVRLFGLDSDAWVKSNHSTWGPRERYFFYELLRQSRRL